MKKVKLLICSLLFVFIGNGSSYASDLRCNDRIVSIGDSKAEVMAKCGAPAFSNIIAYEKDKTISDNVQAVEVAIEQWTYNQGPNTFLKILTFKGGAVVHIEDGQRVYEDSDNPKRFTASIGDTQADIIQRYGQPLYREVVSLESTQYRSAPQFGAGKTMQTSEELVEQWSYSFGPGTFLKVLTFRNGRLIKIEDGGRQ